MKNEEYQVRRIQAENVILTRQIRRLQSGVARLRNTENRIMRKLREYNPNDPDSKEPVFLGDIDEKHVNDFESRLMIAIAENVHLHRKKTTWERRLCRLQAKIDQASDNLHGYNSTDSDGLGNHGTGYMAESDSDIEH